MKVPLVRPGAEKSDTLEEAIAELRWRETQRETSLQRRHLRKEESRLSAMALSHGKTLHNVRWSRRAGAQRRRGRP